MLLHSTPDVSPAVDDCIPRNECLLLVCEESSTANWVRGAVGYIMSVSTFDIRNSRLKNTLSKTTHAMWACRRFLGRIWGLNSSTIRWLFDMMGRPIVTYAIVLWPKVMQVTAINKCNKLHRLLHLSLTGSLRICPMAALKSSLNLNPK